MISRHRSVRVAAAVGATVAAGAATMLALTTTASADEPGRCLQNVNIREEPDAESRIVALCEAGTKVQLGEERDGFVRIDELGGWAAEDYVKADGSSSGGDRSSAGSGDRSRDARDSDDDEQRSSHDDREHGSGGEPSTDGVTSGYDADLDGLLN